MSDHANADRWDSTDAERSEQIDGADTVESYEVDDGVVFYDAQNPLAWVEASTAVLLQEYA